MLRSCAYLCGVLLIGVALVAVPSLMIVESYVGGSAVYGYVEDGRYFVDPKHGQPVVEVSESTWHTVYWMERLWPWSALLPGWAGLFLTAYGAGANRKRIDVPAEPPQWMLQACGVGALVTVAGTALCLYTVGIPWVVMVVGCVLLYASCGTVAALYYRSLRRQVNEADAIDK